MGAVDLEPCAHPTWCARSHHRAASKAAATCAARTTAPNPPWQREAVDWAPPWPDAAGADLLPALAAAWAGHDAQRGAGGWKFLQTHPTGGYNERHVFVNGPFVVTSFNLYGWGLRNDGPAHIVTGLDGTPVSATWMTYGELHCSDGPAELKVGQAPRFARAEHAHGRVMRPAGTTPTTVFATYASLLGIGVEPTAAVDWLAIAERLAAPSPITLVLAMAREGASPAPVAAALDAGVVEISALEQISRGDLPLSWAVAGASR